MHALNCEVFLSEWLEALDQDLSTRRAVEVHLEECAGCRDINTRLTWAWDDLRSLAEVRAPSGLWEQFQRNLHRQEKLERLVREPNSSGNGRGPLHSADC